MLYPSVRSNLAKRMREDRPGTTHIPPHLCMSAVSSRRRLYHKTQAGAKRAFL